MSLYSALPGKQWRRSIPARGVVFCCGVIFAIVMVELFMRAGWFSIFALREYGNHVSGVQSGAYKILCLGDSMSAFTYTPILERILNEKSSGLKFAVINKAIPATTSTVLSAHAQEYIEQYNPQMVIAMMGHNDYQPLLFMPLMGDPQRSHWMLIECLKFILKKHPPTELPATKVMSTDKGAEASKRDDRLEALRRVIEEDPRNMQAYTELGCYYLGIRKDDAAIDLFARAISMNPGSVDFYIKIADIYFNQKRYAEALRMLKAAPVGHENYCFVLRDMARVYAVLKDTPSQVAALEKAVRSGGDPVTQQMLLQFYFDAGDTRRAIELEKKISDQNDPTGNALGCLSHVYLLRKEIKIAKQYADKATAVRSVNLNKTTRANYCRLARLTRDRNIQLVCIQYPLRSVKPLKEMLDGFDNILFFDNENIFWDAVAAKGYAAYFIDNFAGDFGHCTSLGYEMMAANIADNILTAIDIKH